MQSGPIVEEIRTIRDRLAAKFNYDVAAIARDARERDAAGDRLVVCREPRPPVKLSPPPAKTA
jgi:hypothetical protein